VSDLATIKIDEADDLDALIELSVRDQWGDGLPLIPPTRDRVERALAALDLDPDLVLGLVPPAASAATVRNVTINAIMAGCSVSHLPLVFAAVEALCRPSFNALNVQVTTHPVGIGAFVSGPLGEKLGVNAGINTFGPGNRANATVGRAIRLVMLNIGEGVPGRVDKATFGSPLKYTWFFAENQTVSPWPSWTERTGGAPGTTTVTVFQSAGYYNMLETTSSADELLDALAGSMGGPTCNDMLFVGSPVIAISPEHAGVLADGGYDVPTVQRRLWETSRIPVSRFSGSARRYRLQPSWTRLLGELKDDTMIPISATPDDIRIVVTGGPGRHSVYIPACIGSPVSIASVDRYARIRGS